MATLTYYIKETPVGADDFPTLSSMQLAKLEDLGANGNSVVVECDPYLNTAENNVAVILQGWGTTAGNTLTITNSPGQPHGVPGDASTEGFILQVNDTFAAALRVNEDYATVQNISIQNLVTTNSSDALYMLGDYFTVDSLILRGGTGAASSRGLNALVNTAANSIQIRNVLVLQAGDEDFYLASALQGNVDNCTLLGGGLYGLVKQGTNSTLPVTNIVAYGHATADITNVGMTLTDCASGDSSASGTRPITGVVEGDFEDYANGDYRPKVGGKLANVGTDNSARFDDDITGEIR